MTTTYSYDVNAGLPLQLVERTAAGSRKVVYGAQGLAYAEGPDGALEVFHQDGLGSVRAISDAAGNVTQTYRTDEIGITDPAGTAGTRVRLMQYTGEPRAVAFLVRQRAGGLPTTGQPSHA